MLAASHAFGAEWSISIRRDHEPAAFVELEPARLLRTASVAKVFVLMELADRLADRTIDAAQLVDRRDTSPVHDSGIWYALRVDTLPVVDVAVLVGAVSDNRAANALVDLCGLDRVQSLAATAAPGGSMLLDRVRDDRSGDVPATLSVGCAADWSAIMRRLYDARSPVLDWLAQDTDLSLVAAAFDLDPLAHDTEDLGLRLWHKTGTDAGVRADVGVLRGASGVASYAVIANWPAADTGPATRRAVHSAMRRIGAEIVSGVVGPDDVRQ